MSDAKLEGAGLLEAPEERILKYLYTCDRPEWDYLAGHRAFSENWLILFLRRPRPVSRDAFMEIYGNKNWRKSYRVVLWLLRCKNGPPAITMNLVASVRWLDLLHTLRLPHLAGGLRKRIEDEMMEVVPRLALGEKIAIARQAPRDLIKHLRCLAEPQVINALLANYHFTYEDALFIASFPKSKAGALAELAGSPRWTSFREVKLALLRHPNIPNSCLLPLAGTLRENELQSVLRDPKLKLYTRRLIHRILQDRFLQKRVRNDTDRRQKRG